MLPVDETIWSSSTSTAPTSSATNRRTTQLQPKSNSNHAQVLYDVENFSADWTLDHDAATRTATDEMQRSEPPRTVAE